MIPMATLLGRFPAQGRVEWIGARPARAQPMVALASAMLVPGTGVEGDRFAGALDSKRQVTLIQHEHLGVVASLLGRAHVSPATLRRNIVVSGINVAALQRVRFAIGGAQLEGTGPCHPCSKMEEALGPGGFNAMRGHGGITARVVIAGEVRVGDPLVVLATVSTPNEG